MCVYMCSILRNSASNLKPLGPPNIYENVIRQVNTIYYNAMRGREEPFYFDDKIFFKLQSSFAPMQIMMFSKFYFFFQQKNVVFSPGNDVKALFFSSARRNSKIFFKTFDHRQLKIITTKNV